MIKYQLYIKINGKDNYYTPMKQNLIKVIINYGYLYLIENEIFR